jgi:hypothetical protein
LANSGKRGPSQKLLSKRKQRQKLMDHLRDHSIDLMTYMKAIGGQTSLDTQNLDIGDIDLDSDSDGEDEDDDVQVLDQVEATILSNRQSVAGDDLRNLRQHLQMPSQQFRMTIKDGYAEVLAEERLLSMNMQLSPTQIDTPNDGNCMLHAILDQLQYDPAFENFAQDQFELRQSLVNLLNVYVMNGRIEWPGDISISEWQDCMRQDEEQGDHVLLLLAAEVFSRPIIVFPASPEEQQTRIEPMGVSTSVHPLYLMYFSEQRYTSGHYQSIRPHGPIAEPESLNQTAAQHSNPSIAMSLSMDFGSENRPSILSLPGCDEDFSLPEMQSTVVNESTRSRCRRPRELSNLDQTNIIEEGQRKRTRRQ